VCGTKNSAGLIALCKTLLPREKKLPINRTITLLGSFEDAHHRARAVTDACIRRASTPLFSTQTSIILVDALTCMLIPSTKGVKPTEAHMRINTHPTDMRTNTHPTDMRTNTHPTYT
jgi:hypothetical protein